MMKKTYFYLFLFCAISFSGHAQESAPAPKASPFSGLKIRPTLSADFLVGPTFSFSYGDFIDDQSGFTGIKYPEVTVSNSIKPRIFFALGGQARLRLFDEGIGSYFTGSLGMYYYQRGYRNVYSFDVAPAGLSITDNMVYSESYRINHVALPFLLRVGKKWFVEGGFCIVRTLGGSRTQSFSRSISGSDAYQGGFSTSESNTFALADTMLYGSPASIMINVGGQLTKGLGFRITNSFDNRTFVRTNDFSSYNLQLHLLINLFNFSPLRNETSK
jgi:hypothetical protein